MAANRGFSLVEALIAVVLAGGGIAALVTATGGTERAESRMLQAEKMQRLAVSKLDEIIATNDQNAQGGDFADQGEPGLEWTVTVDTASVENVEQVTVQVTKPDDSTVQQTVGTLHYRPPVGADSGGNQ